MATEQLINRRVVRVPDVLGRTLTKAQILLEDAGLAKIVTCIARATRIATPCSNNVRPADR